MDVLIRGNYERSLITIEFQTEFYEKQLEKLYEIKTPIWEGNFAKLFCIDADKTEKSLCVAILNCLTFSTQHFDMASSYYLDICILSLFCETESNNKQSFVFVTTNTQDNLLWGCTRIHYICNKIHKTHKNIKRWNT